MQQKHLLYDKIRRLKKSNEHFTKYSQTFVQQSPSGRGKSGCYAEAFLKHICGKLLLLQVGRCSELVS